MIIANRRRGKKHHIIINAEGVGHSTSMAKRIEAATGIETRANHPGTSAARRQSDSEGQSDGFCHGSICCRCFDGRQE